MSIMRRVQTWPLRPSESGADPYLARVQHEWWSPGRSIRFVRRHNHVVLLVLDGKGSFRAGATTYALHSGSVLSLVPEIPHRIDADLSHPLQTLRLIIAGTDPSAWLSQATGSASGAWRPRSWDSLRDLGLRMKAEAQRGDAQAPRIAAHLLAIFAADLQRGLGSSTGPDDLAERARALIAKQPRQAPSLNELAARCGVSPEHLCRRFTAAFGEAPMRYAQGLRQHEAEELLSDDGATLAEIARQLGYADAFAFSKAFRRWTRRSPSQWKRERRA